MWKPNVLLFGPAGAKCFLLVGAAKRLYEEKDFLSEVHTYAGVSAGAALSLLLVLGYTVEEIENICLDLNIIEDIMNINLVEIKDNLGILKINSIEEKLKKCIIDKIGYIPTLKQLFILTGKRLVTVTLNLDKLKVEYLSKDTEPDLSCSEAVMMSMIVPILIQPRKYKGCIYVDGALGAPYPVKYFDENNNNVLGIYVSSEDDPNSIENNIKLYMYKLIQVGMKIIRETEIKYSSKNVKHISLKTLIKDTTGIMIDRETRQKMVKYGYDYTESFLKINKNPEKYCLELQEDEEIPFSVQFFQ